jgi:hypothetical protein
LDNNGAANVRKRKLGKNQNLEKPTKNNILALDKRAIVKNGTSEQLVSLISRVYKRGYRLFRAHQFRVFSMYESINKSN